MRFVILGSILLVAIKSMAVPIIKSGEEVKFENIPVISKTFKGAKNRAEKKELQIQCEKWVLETLKSLEQESVHKYWCSYKTDVVLREYNFVGKIVLRNWK